MNTLVCFNTDINRPHKGILYKTYTIIQVSRSVITRWSCKCLSVTNSRDGNPWTNETTSDRNTLKWPLYTTGFCIFLFLFIYSCRELPWTDLRTLMVMWHVRVRLKAAAVFVRMSSSVHTHRPVLLFLLGHYVDFYLFGQPKENLIPNHNRSSSWTLAAIQLQLCNGVCQRIWEILENNAAQWD